MNMALTYVKILKRLASNEFHTYVGIFWGPVHHTQSNDYLINESGHWPNNLMNT